jgi:pimeloyl-ACP methyl ester carboxylesterase
MKYVYEKRWEIHSTVRLEWGRVHVPKPRGILFVPPLIGGDYVQQIRHFRRLIRRGYDLVSFNFAGHGGSTDKFSLEGTIRDTRIILDCTRRIGRREGLPIFGIGACYPAIPLLFLAGSPEGRFQKVILINAILGLSPRAVVRSFLDYYGHLRRTQRRAPRLMEALRRYVDFIFPGVAKSRRGFGALERHRTRLFKTLYDAFVLNPLKSIRLSRTPVLCLYSTDDPVLNLFDGMFGSDYEAEVRRVCPLARFRKMSTDHFLSHPRARTEVLEDLIRFL